MKLILTNLIFQNKLIMISIKNEILVNSIKFPEFDFLFKIY